MTQRLEILSDYIREELGHEGALDADCDLLEEEVLDSFSIVELAVFVQGSFGVELEPDDLSRENFSSLNRILALIDQRSDG